MSELGIVDIREIIRGIKSVNNYDFSSHALTSFKQRLEKIMRLHAIASAEGLIKKIQEDDGFFDTFLYEISVPSTEMFRDPSLWRWLREEYFPETVDRSSGKLKIWFPSCVSGGELFSMAILLSEMGITDKAQISASTLSEKSIEYIRSGLYDLKKLEVSQENYKRFNGNKELAYYYKPEKDYVVRNASLIEPIEFRKLNVNFDFSPQNIKLILFRNSLIYYNPSMQDRILQILHRSLAVGGYLILGIRERVSGLYAGKEFELINETESIYRKKI